MTTHWILRPIAEVKLGDHLCCLYQTEAEHRAVLAPFLVQGLTQGQKVLYIVDAHTHTDILNYVRAGGLEVEPYLASGQLTILTADQTYLRDGRFDPDRMVDLVRAMTGRALAEGYTALRVTGEMTWTLRGLPDTAPLLEYEAKIEKFLSGSACLAMCQYDRRCFEPALLLDIFTAHPTLAMGAEIYTNFYYIPPPEGVTADPSAAILRFRLENLAGYRQAEEKLRRSEEHFRALIENASDFIMILDADGAIRYQSPSIERALGYKAGELAGRRFFDMVHPDDVANAARILTEAMQIPDSTASLEVRVPHAGGSWRTWEVAIKNLLEHPAVAGLVINSRDITERQQGEEALETQRRRLQALFDHTLDAILLINDQAQYIDANPAACALIGCSRQELAGLTLWDITPEEDRELARELWQRFICSVELTGEYTILRRDGTTVETEFRAISNILPGLHLSVLRDITGRKQAEAEIQRHTARMEALAEISRALAEAGFDSQTVFETITRQTARTIGDACVLTLLSDDGLWFNPVAFHHPEPQAKALMSSILVSAPHRADHEPIAQLWRTGQPLFIPVVPQDQIRQRFQPEYWPYIEQVGIHSLLIVPLRLKGRLIGTLGVTRDAPGNPYTIDDQAFLLNLADRAALTITNARLFEQVHSAHERLQTLSRRLLQVQEAERRQIARELHDEIGQVLTGLKLILDMNPRLPAEIARSRLAEAQALVNDLMDRVDELSLDLRPPMLDHLGLLPTLLWHFERYTRQTGVHVMFKHIGLEGQRFTPEVETAAYRIVQEALTNVARYAQVSQAKVQLWANHDTLDIQVKDQGRGFDAEAMLAAGAANGLSGMRERAALLGGQFAIESTPEAGTCLTVELPLYNQLERVITNLAAHHHE